MPGAANNNIIKTNNTTEFYKLMTTQLSPIKCDGYSCSVPKACCKQGCCYLLSPSYNNNKSISSSIQTGTGTLFYSNPLFLGHWYFWLAVTATIAGILCACSLWRKHSQGGGICCRTSSNHRNNNRNCSSEPDSIGSCYAPPQYSSCNNFHAPPPPYNEVTSKPDMYPLVITYNNVEPIIKNSNNSGTGYLIQYFRSFIRPAIGSMSATSTNDSLSLCNALNEANNLVPPTYSNIASLEELAMGSSSLNPSPSNSERRLPRSTSSVSSATTEYHQILPHSPSAPIVQSSPTFAGIHINSSVAASSTVANKNKIPSSYSPKASSSNAVSPPTTRPILRPHHNHRHQNRPLPQRSQDSTEDEELFSALLNLSICAPNSGCEHSGVHPQSTTILQDLGVTNSMTGSDISSLANLGTPDSPPRATSPTSVEMKELLNKIQQLPAQKSPQGIAGIPSGRGAYFHKMRAKTMYMPLGDIQLVNSGKSFKNIPSVFSKKWLSHSAPCTPCGALPSPVFSKLLISNKDSSKTKISSDESPLLLMSKQQYNEETSEEEEAQQRNIS